jgi:hypothetical protein
MTDSLEYRRPYSRGPIDEALQTFGVKSSEYHCDWRGCTRSPGWEVFWDRHEESGWSYLCNRHLWFARIRSRLHIGESRLIGWCDACSPVETIQIE